MYCYKVLFGFIYLLATDVFEWTPIAIGTVSSYRLQTRVRSSFFTECVIIAWNSSPEKVDSSSLRSFTYTRVKTNLFYGPFSGTTWVSWHQNNQQFSKFMLSQEVLFNLPSRADPVSSHMAATPVDNITGMAHFFFFSYACHLP